MAVNDVLFSPRGIWVSLLCWLVPLAFVCGRSYWIRKLPDFWLCLIAGLVVNVAFCLLATLHRRVRLATINPVLLRDGGWQRIMAFYTGGLALTFVVAAALYSQ